MTHDQKFVRVCIEEMLVSTCVCPYYLLVDNCTLQCKSAEHFFYLKCIADQINKPLTRVFGIAGHGKGENNHVGALQR